VVHFKLRCRRLVLLFPDVAPNRPRAAAGCNSSVKPAPGPGRPPALPRELAALSL
jgi:hypothetical protein